MEFWGEALCDQACLLGGTPNGETPWANKRNGRSNVLERNAPHGRSDLLFNCFTARSAQSDWTRPGPIIKASYIANSIELYNMLNARESAPILSESRQGSFARAWRRHGDFLAYGSKLGSQRKSLGRFVGCRTCRKPDGACWDNFLGSPSRTKR